MNRLRIAALAAAGFASACASPDLYRWGRYEASVAAMYATSSGYDPAAEAARLIEQIEETQNRGRLVPPGVRAHVGFLLIEAGNGDRGVTYLQAEKVAFPESAVFVDGLLARAWEKRS